ncbi:MAG: hypothetical protein LBJ18_02000 [Rickettsiales bacterium]|jgi:hypothetical protein|nr:hypothetical protein [Rickettsiales bacterium]
MNKKKLYLAGLMALGFMPSGKAQSTNIDSITNLPTKQFLNYMIAAAGRETKIEIDTIFINSEKSVKENISELTYMGGFFGSANIIKIPYYLVDLSADFGKYDAARVESVFNAYNAEAALRLIHEKRHAMFFALLNKAAVSFEDLQRAVVYDEIQAYFAEMLEKRKILKETGLVPKAFPLAAMSFSGHLDGDTSLFNTANFFQIQDANADKLKKLMNKKWPESFISYINFLMNQKEIPDTVSEEEKQIILKAIQDHLWKTKSEYMENMPAIIKNQIVRSYSARKSANKISFGDVLEQCFDFGTIKIRIDEVENFADKFINHPDFQKECQILGDEMQPLISQLKSNSR